MYKDLLTAISRCDEAVTLDDVKPLTLAPALAAILADTGCHMTHIITSHITIVYTLAASLTFDDLFRSAGMYVWYDYDHGFVLRPLLQHHST